MIDVKNGKGLVISDIHLGQPGSVGYEALDEVSRHISQQRPSLIVLNGDIIEGKHTWGTMDAVNRRLDSAVARVEQLVEEAREANPDAKIVYVFGNHDCRYEILERLWQIAEKYPDNFHMEEAYLKHGNTLFAHGDLQSGYKPEASGRKIASYSVGKKRHESRFAGGPIDARPHGDGHFSDWGHIKPKEGRKGLTDRVVTTAFGRVDRVIAPAVFPPIQLIEAFYHSFEEQAPEELEGVRNICLGHIHMDFARQFRHDEKDVTVRFTGSATKSSDDTMYRFDINGEDLSNFEAVALAKSPRKAASHQR